MGLLTAAALKGLSLCHVYIQPATAQQVPVFKLLRELPTCGIWEPISSTDGAWPAIGWRPPEAHAGLGLQCRSLRHCCATASLKLAAQVLAPQRPGWLLKGTPGRQWAEPLTLRYVWNGWEGVGPAAQWSKHWRWASAVWARLPSERSIQLSSS